MKLLKTLTLLLTFGLLVSCEQSEDEVGPDKTLVGKWNITNTNLIGLDIPADGSYLSFSDCDNSTCSGVDYKGSDGTSGTFTYTQNNEVSIEIVDNDMSEGGNYNGIWAIQSFTATKLILKKTTLFGAMVITLKK